MPSPRSHSVLVSAARMYYLDGKSQGEIAKALNVSRSSVSRILSDARERGIVEIRLHPEGPLGRRGDLEALLAEATGVGEVFVASRHSGRRPIDVVAELAARVLEGRLPELTSLGVSWGATVAAMAQHALIEPIHQRIDLYPLVGGMPTLGTGPSGHEALDTLARKGGFTVHRFEAPAIVESETTWKALLGETSVRTAIEAAAGVPVAIVGIGSIGIYASPHIVSAMNLSAEEEREFLAQKPVGDICGQFYDARGDVLGPPTSERVIGITLDQLRAIPQVMGVAAGREKAPGVAGALRSGVLEVLVVDEDLAEAVLPLLND